MWDSTPYLEALRHAASPCVREDPGLLEFVERIVMLSGERRPVFAAEAHDDLSRATHGFVYDRTSGLFFFSGWADHERTASNLMAMYRLRAPVDWERTIRKDTSFDGLLADEYIQSGRGFLANSPRLTKSSGGWPLNVGAEVVLSAQEKMWFKSMTLRRQP